MKRGIFVVACAILSLVLAIGCGDSDSDNGSETSGGEASVTKAQFLEQANAVCKQVINEKNALVRETFNQFKKEGKSLELENEEAAVVAEKALPPVTELPDKLRELEAPEGDEEKIEAIAQSYEDAVAEMEEDPEKIYAANYPFKEGDELAEKYGLTVCRL